VLVADLDEDGVKELLHLDHDGLQLYLQARDAATGAPLWDTRSSGAEMAFVTTPLMVAGPDGGGGQQVVATGMVSTWASRVNVFSSSGGLVASFEPEECPLVAAATTAHIDAGPALLLVCSSGMIGGPVDLVALSLADWTVQWRAPLNPYGYYLMPPESISVADLDGDGRDEVVTHLGGIELGFVDAFDGDGTLLWSSWSFAAARSVPVADVDGDGEQEILVVSGSGGTGAGFTVLAGATGELEWSSSDHGVSFVGAAHPALADIDADGWLEMVAVAADPASAGLLAVDSAATGGPAPGGEIVEQVLWRTERRQPLAAGQQLQLDEDIGPLGQTGQFWYRGFYYNGRGQLLASDRHPFVVVDSNLALVLVTDRELYKTSEAVTVSGRVEELEGLPVSPLLRVSDEDKGLVLFERQLSLEPLGRQDYSFTVDAAVAGVHNLKASLELDGIERSVARTRYRVAAPQVSVSFGGPEVAGVEPFDLAASFENAGEVESAFSATLVDPDGSREQRQVVLQPGETNELVFRRSISADGVFELRTEGDLERSLLHPIDFGLEAAVEAEPLAFYSAAEDVYLPWRVYNLGALAFTYPVELTVRDGQGRTVAGRTLGVELEPAGDPLGKDIHEELWTLALPAGTYSFAVSATYGGTDEQPFTVGLSLARGRLEPQPRYPAGAVSIPWALENLSGLAAEYQVQLVVAGPEGVVADPSRRVWLAPAGQAGSLFQGNLNLSSLGPGEYTVSLAGPRLEDTVRASFQVIEHSSLSLRLEAGPASCGVQPLEVFVSNEGWDDFSGRLELESSFWTGVLQLQIDGLGGQWSTTVEMPLEAAPVGQHPVELRVLDQAGGTVASASHLLQVRGGVCELATIPAGQIVQAGTEAGFTFAVSNPGDSTAVCRLELGAFEQQGPESVRLEIAPCQQRQATFTYWIPDDLESRHEMLPYRLEPAAEGTSGGEEGLVNFEVYGVDLEATASVDRCFYRPGDIARLDLLVVNNGLPAGNLLIEVSYPGVEFFEPFDLSAGSASLSFDVPLGDIQADRIYYSISSASGRNLLIDTKRVHGSDAPVWLCTNKDTYDAGETMTLDFGADADCRFNLRLLAANFEHQQQLAAGQTGSVEISLPSVIAGGTHVIEYGCDSLEQRHPFEVRSPRLRIVSLRADSDFYLPGSPVALEALVESEADFTGLWHCQGLRPDGSTFEMETRQVDFQTGYRLVPAQGLMDTGIAGTHRIFCSAYRDPEGQVMLARDSTRVRVGDFELVSITADKPAYESGYDSATVFVNMWGHASGVELEVEYDGQPLYTGPVDLDGFTTLPIQIPTSMLEPLGGHLVSGSLSHDGLRSDAGLEITTRDTTPPQIMVRGITDGAVYDRPVSATVEIIDVNPDFHNTRLDGAYWPEHLPIGADGAHVFEVEAYDLAGNSSRLALAFTIDTTPPRIVVSGVTEGGCYPVEVRPEISVVDAGLDFVNATLDGAPFESGAVVGEGDHLLEVEAVDAAGNTASTSISFVVDLTDPLVTISGFTDGLVTEQPVVPVVTVSDENLAAEGAYLNGTSLQPGTVVDEEGRYLVLGWGADCAGRNSQSSAGFSIDRSPPVIQIYGVTDGGCYRPPVFPLYSVFDENPSSVSATLDGSEFESGGEVDAEGHHLLEITAADAIGHTSSVSAGFVLDATPPVVSIEGVEDGGVYFAPPVPLIYASDDNLAEVVVLLDGEPFESATPVETPGEHVIRVLASDCAGNGSVVEMAFTVILRPSFHFAACSFGEAYLYNHAGVLGAGDTQNSGGDIAAHGDVVMTNHAFVLGDVVAGGDVRLDNHAGITGDVYLAGDLVLEHASSVDGEVRRLDVPPEPCECGYDLDAVLEWRSTNNDNDLLESDPVIAPFIQDGSLEIDCSCGCGGRCTVVLPAGAFYLEQLVLRGNAELALAEGAQVELYLRSGLVVERNARMPGDPARAGDLLVVLGADTEAGGRLVLENNTDLALMLYAPRARLALPNRVYLHGAVVVRSLVAGNHGRLLGEGVGADGPPPLSCP